MAQVSTEFRLCDRLGGWKARWGIGRMSYLVPPGLYAIGAPSPDDPVVVTANYKMSYDIVRRELAGRNAWLLVLETFGINVWCAAGKGTFGTGELVQRIEAVNLHRVVRHRLLLLPILGAPGVAAHEVKKRTGFTVRYATVRAADLPELLDNGMVTTPAMRELTFTFRERLVLVPVELVGGLKPTIIIGAILFMIGGIWNGHFEAIGGIKAVIAYLGAVLTGTVVTPLLLPWLPTASFAIKGAVAGGVWGIAWRQLAGDVWGTAGTAAALLALAAVSSFYALNFTGSTPFTSRSGVKKEMRLALPVMGCALLSGAILWLAEKLL